MTFKTYQCFATSIFALGVLGGTYASQALADPALQAKPQHDELVQNVRQHWAKIEARHSFNKLSDHSLQALQDILEANQYLSKQEKTEALNELKLARDDLAKALVSHSNFKSLASKVKKEEAAAKFAHNLAKYSNDNWSPVGGTFVAKSSLSKKEADILAQANHSLEMKNVPQAYKLIRPIENKVQIAIAIAPLKPITQSVEEALSDVEKSDLTSAKAKLDQAIKQYVFIPQRYMNMNPLTCSKCKMIAHR
ncbi:YfdX family protein [Aristophania vespae]|uniref:YfdX family protein n=1 Tax=Aristophania vespae TaxID=2697033 RepID=A0A6P1NHE3_9PROT|nr:YfdX family protein [Aristophania vespae]QHI95950.1 YfdX family protein [Aristophania vespae]